MDSEVKAAYLLIYKGGIFIGSYGCKNDWLAVHFNCHKRRGSWLLPLSLFSLYVEDFYLQYQFSYAVNGILLDFSLAS